MVHNSDAVSDPWAVMIHPSYACSTYGAVMRPWRFDLFAFHTVPISNVASHSSVKLTVDFDINLFPDIKLRIHVCCFIRSCLIIINGIG